MIAAETATTFLFVPADRPERFDKARASAADLVIIDLEDAVAPDRKAAGRAAIAATGPALPAGLAVRINPLGTEAAALDQDLLGSLTGLAAVVVPKAEDPSALNRLHDALGVPLVALIESAAGVAGVGEIARCSGVVRLAFGHLDYALDLGIAPAGEMITHARCEIAVASRAAAIAAPVDGVTAELDDPTVAGADARAGAALGFGAKLCIHPRQIAAVAEAFKPGPTEIEWASGICAVADGGASRAGSQMVDAPLLKRAQAVLKAAGVA